MECRWQDPVPAPPGTVRWAPPDACAHKEAPLPLQSPHWQGQDPVSALVRVLYQ